MSTMTMTTAKRIITFGAAAGLLLTGAGAHFSNVHAQTAEPKLFITWKARTYAPGSFAGKILPTANSSIVASVELIDGGKVIDLAKQTVYWYLNNDFLQGGVALQEVTFRAPDAAGGTLDLRAEIPNYKTGSVLKTTTIPIAAPEVVIEAPFPAGAFSSPKITLAGVPYFFNARDPSRLNFSWTVNGQAPAGAENPQALTISTGSGAASGSSVEVALTVRNPAAALELGSKSITLTYQP